MKTYSIFLTSVRAIKASVLIALFALVGVPAQAQAGQTDGEWAFFDNNVTPASESVVTGSNWAESLTPPDAVSSLDATGWTQFGHAIERALDSDHKAVQQAALRLIIAYGEDLNFSSSAVVDVIHLYREGNTEPVRRMAAVSLSKMKSQLAMGFLERSSNFEESAIVKTTIDAILAEAKS